MQTAITISVKGPNLKQYLSTHKKNHKKYHGQSLRPKITVHEQHVSDVENFGDGEKKTNKMEQFLKLHQPNHISHQKMLEKYRKSRMSHDKKIYLTPKMKKKSLEVEKSETISPPKSENIDIRSEDSLTSDDTMDNLNPIHDQIETQENQKNLLIDSIRKQKQQINVLKLEAHNIIKPPLLACFGLQKKTAADKINFHLLALKLFAEFTRDSRKNIQDQPQWQELNFLLYKRYYLERVKVQSFLKKHPIKNPFHLECSVSCKEALDYMKKSHGKNHLQIIQQENLEIAIQLRNYYNSIIQKSGGKINLLEQDHKFSDFLYKELWQMFVLTQFETSNEKKFEKMCRILQLGFLISELDNNFIVSVTEAEIYIYEHRQTEYICKYRRVFEENLLI